MSKDITTTTRRIIMPKVKTAPNIVPHTPFEVYREKYKDHFFLERSESGVLTAKWHTKGDSLIWDFPIHRAIHQLTTDVSQDVETEVFILGGTGHFWIGDIHASVAENEASRRWLSYEHMYYDGTNICEGLVNDLEIPTIGVINGPGFHTEMALFCDISIMSEDAVIIDPHTAAGLVPGDGVQIAYRIAMGYKRGNYAILTNEKIDAKKALEYGMVNEVVPKAKVYERAKELGETLAKQDRIMRRITTQILRQPLKMALAQELRHAFGSEMHAYLASQGTHDPETMDKLGAERSGKKE
jgi:enoyl-CoA hydratase/carnithine racemase